METYHRPDDVPVDTDGLTVASLLFNHHLIFVPLFVLPLRFVICQQRVLCASRRGEDEDDDRDGKGKVNGLLRIARGVFLGVTLH